MSKLDDLLASVPKDLARQIKAELSESVCMYLWLSGEVRSGRLTLLYKPNSFETIIVGDSLRSFVVNHWRK